MGSGYYYSSRAVTKNHYITIITDINLTLNNIIGTILHIVTITRVVPELPDQAKKTQT